ncbi:MAG: DUF3024 domain-containing protein [Vicingaceae bacterium]
MYTIEGKTNNTKMTNSTIDLNEATLKSYVEAIRPNDLEIRQKLDFGYSYDGQIALLFTIRPDWRNPEKIQNSEFAKIRYYKTQRIWKLYWMRATGKWELYEPSPQSTHLEKLLDIVKEDKHHCFHG